MSKKQTTNTFGKGMMLDLHPLTVPADVLTDALNATTITMNGNEGILQNDMGNGRVESAFLPPGYVPVGIKEYGGIIYVASYNPITNKSQIGSFPSPERNIDQTEEGQLDNPLELLNTQYKRNYKFNEFNTYNNGSLQIGLGGLTNKVEIFGDYKVIRSGDKFGFYFGNSQDNKDLLSNYFSFIDKNNRAGNSGNTSINDVGGWDEKNKVYQNNIVTLSTQVLDSNNNLRDLTHQLKRYDSQSKPIKFTDESEDDRFNAGYFIGRANNDWDPVNQERNKKALNTYNNKLFGRLYLVGQVNVIDHIDVQLVTKSYADQSLVAFNEELKDYTESNILYFYIDYYYNLPLQYLEKPTLYIYYDNTFKSATGIFERFNDKTLSTYKINSYQGSITIEQCDKYINDERPGTQNCKQIQKQSEDYNRIINYQNNGGIKIATVSSDNSDDDINVVVIPNNIESPTYDPITNLYRKRYVAYVVLNEEEYSIYNNDNLKDNTILNYVIIPQMQNIPGETSPSKLTHIAYEGSIDLSKIGSGECNITTWRYICTDNMIKLNWGLEDYPLDTDVIEDMRMDFYDWNNRDTLLQDIEDDFYSDWYLMFNQISYNSVNTSITFSDDTLKKRHIYLVKLSRKKNGNYESIGWRILITTPIYNDLFMIYDDYCSNKAKQDILSRNNVNINTKISIEASNKSQSTSSIQFHKLGENNTYILCDDFSDIRNEIDNNTYSYITYTSFITTKTIKVNLEIPEIYPFEFNDPSLMSYNVSYNSSITKNIKDNIINEQTLPIIDINYNIEGILTEYENKILNPQIEYKGNSNITVENKYNIPSQAIYKYGNLRPITSKRRYESLYNFIVNNLQSNTILFPFIGGHDNNNEGSSHFNLFSYEYDSGAMKHHIRKDIVHISGKVGIAKNLSTYKNKINEVLQGIGLEDNTFIIIGSPTTFGWEDWTGNGEFEDIETGACSQKIISNINTYISEINDTIEDQEDKIDPFSPNTTGNFMLRRDAYHYGSELNKPKQYKLNEDPAQNTTDKKWFEKGETRPVNSGNKFSWGHKDWFMLLWKNKDGDFTIVDNFYAFDNEFIKKNEYDNYNLYTIGVIPNGYFKDNHRKYSKLTLSDSTKYSEEVIGDRTNIQNWIIDKVFGEEYAKSIFFNITGQDTFYGCFIDSNTIQYNTNYTVEVQDSITLNNIKFMSELLKYYSSDKIVDSEANENSFSKLIIPEKIQIGGNYVQTIGNNKADELIDYLEFNLDSNTNPKEFDISIYNISGMNNFLDHISNDNICEGCIKKDGKIYTLDSEGLDIIGDIYVFENEKPVIASLVENNKEFINSLMIKNNNLLISNYSTNKSQHYAFSYGDRPGGGHTSELVVKIDFPHIRVKQDDSVNLIFGL